MGNGWCEVTGWNLMPDTLLLDIFTYLDTKQLVTVSEVCWHWARISKDNSLWRRRLALDFNLSSRAKLAADNEDGSWFYEYCRLIDDCPRIESEILHDHEDEVLHVAFNNDGDLFSTCSKDCTLKIWRLSLPCVLLHDKDLAELFRWKYTQFAEFNPDGTLILVSGVHVGALTTSGEIAVFELKGDDLEFRCRVLNKPYDVFGCWYDIDHIVNGELHWINETTSTADIYLCTASQEVESEQTSVMAKVFKFFHRNASTLHMALISSHVSQWLRYAVEMTNKFVEAEKAGVQLESNLPTVEQFCRHMEETKWKGMGDDTATGATTCRIWPDKLLIFCTGQLTYTPHQIGFKLLKGNMVRDLFDAEVMSPERAQAVMERLRRYRQSKQNSEEGSSSSSGSASVDNGSMEEEVPAAANNGAPPAQGQQNVELSWQEIMDKFDFADHTMEMHGHIVGMALTNDERYLFVNVRPWPDGCIVSNPREPPPIAQQIEVRVIDLETLSLLDICYRAHKGFTPSDECFFIFLDACDQFVASGSEDSFAYVWDRHFGCLLGKLPHTGVVNSVAFHPKDPSLLITASDDQTIKVWRSKSTMREIEKGKLEGYCTH